MSDNKGMTELIETGRGFVGKYVTRSRTKANNLPRVKFQIFVGINNPSILKFSIIRECIATGAAAEKLADIASGSWIWVKGFLVRNPVHDNDGHVVYENDTVKTREYLIVSDAKVLSNDGAERQLSLSGEVAGRQVG